MSQLDLAYETPPQWAAEVLEDPRSLLCDHAYCELGAASSAQGLIARYPSRSKLVERMGALAVEEMRHFRQVHRLLVKLGGELSPVRSNPYVEGLLARGRRGGEERLLDRLLVSALIERRSLERFELLADRAPGEVGALYRELGPSERGHGILFRDLAVDAFGEDEVAARLAELQAVEGALVASLDFAVAIHSGPPLPVSSGTAPGNQA